MTLLEPHGSYQRQMIQAQELDLKYAKQGPVPGCLSLCGKFMITEKSSLFLKHTEEVPSFILLKPETGKEVNERGREGKKRED